MIILQFDGRYAHWGLLMLRSLALHEPGKKVLVDVVNLDPEQRSGLARVHPGVIVRWETWEETSPERMVNRKCAVLQRVRDEHPREPWYCLMDADFLIRRPLSDLWSLMLRAEAALIMTNGVWKGRVYQHLKTPAGLVIVRPDGWPLIDCWSRLHAQEDPIAGIRPGAWFWDQVTLWKAKEETPLRYAVIPIGEFADCQLNKGTAIWSAHVAREDKERYYPIFLKEHERQVSEASV